MRHNWCSAEAFEIGAEGATMKLGQYFSMPFKLKTPAAAGIAAVGLFAFVAMSATAPPYLPLNVHVGEKAPNFTLPSASGGTVSLSQFAGHNVLLNFYEGYW
jgi:hypothetical protein